MKEIKLIAKSSGDTGMLPMKQSADLEAKKTMEQKNIELCNFIKNAFVADGEVQFVQSEKPFITKQFFVVEDSQRGTFLVAMKK